MNNPFRLSDGKEVKDVQELISICKTSSKDCEKYLVNKDFERWFRGIKEDELANIANQSKGDISTFLNNSEKYLEQKKRQKEIESIVKKYGQKYFLFQLLLYL